MTYEFGNVMDYHLYEVEMFAIPVKTGCHFAASSRWKNAIICGSISYGEVYGLDSIGPVEYLNEPFCAIKNQEQGKILYTKHEEASPGESEVYSYTMKWNGYEYRELYD